MKSLIAPSLMLLCLVGCENALRPTVDAKRDTPNSSAVETRKDNTVVNERDRSGDTKTPIDQNENQKDIDITANIRKRVVDTDMSTSAHNSKIITQEGKVTLRGPVQSEEEKKQIEQIAIDVAGAGNVENLLEVQP